MCVCPCGGTGIVLLVCHNQDFDADQPVTDQATGRAVCPLTCQRNSAAWNGKWDRTAHIARLVKKEGEGGGEWNRRHIMCV